LPVELELLAGAKRTTVAAMKERLAAAAKQAEEASAVKADEDDADVAVADSRPIAMKPRPTATRRQADDETGVDDSYDDEEQPRSTRCEPGPRRRPPRFRSGDNDRPPHPQEPVPRRRSRGLEHRQPVQLLPPGAGSRPGGDQCGASRVDLPEPEGRYI